MFDKTIPLNEFITLQRGFDLPKSKRQEGSIPVIASTGIAGYHNEAKVKPPGVVIGRSGSIGGGQYIEEDYWPLNTSLWIKDFKGHHPKYIYYLMKSIDFSGFNAGTGVPTLNRNHLSSLLVADISYEREQEIADALSALDDKISNNTAMNATLEKIAQRIFKSWFVDFDPVKANAEGVPFDGLSPEIQSLFPNEFEESELGMIPKGWEESTIENEVKTVGGATPSTKNTEFWDEGENLWTTPKDLSGLKDKIIFNTARKITSKGLKKISSGLLPKNTVLMSSRAPVGYLAIAKEPMAINQGYIAMKCEKDITPYYLLCWLDKNMDIIKQRAGGTTFSEISKSNFRPIVFLKPSVDAINKFENLVTPLFEKIEINARMVKTLSSIRDKLLPRLISGKITIQKAEEMLEEAI